MNRDLQLYPFYKKKMKKTPPVKHKLSKGLKLENFSYRTYIKTADGFWGFLLYAVELKTDTTRNKVSTVNIFRTYVVQDS